MRRRLTVGVAMAVMLAMMVASAGMVQAQTVTHQLSVSKLGAGGGTVTSSPAGIHCGSTGLTCSANFDAGTSVTLTAAANLNATFNGWSGGNGTVNDNGTYTVSMSEARSVTATFKANQAISFTSTPPDNVVVGDTYLPQATGGSSGNAVTFGATSACSYNAGTGLVTMNSDGTCTVTADQAESINFNAAPQAKQQFSVAPATRATETALTRTAGANPSTYGDNVTFTATVTATGGNPNAQGNVTFKNGANAISGCSNVALGGANGNAAACTTSNLPVAGSPHSITAEYSGTSSGSPRFEQSTSSALSHSVNAKALTVSGLSAQDKVYNGNTNATITGTLQLQGVISPEVVTLSGTVSGSFANKNVGSNKPVTVSGLSLSGAQAGNYSLSLPTSLTANITARDLTVDATGVNKVYDGTTGASVTQSTDKVSTDTVNADYTSAAFASKNVGTGITVNVSGISISGTDAGNYNLLNTSAQTTANITAKNVTGSFTADNKVYDGTTDATVLTRSVNGAINGDVVNLTGGTATFNDANVGTGKTVTLTGATLGGADAGNYNLTSVNTTTAGILAWTPEGFYSPIGISNSFYQTKGQAVPAATSTTVWQVAKGGSTIPLKFNVSAGDEKKTNTDAVKGFGAVKLSTCSGSTLDSVEELSTTGSTSLRYDATEGQFIQNWKTGTVSGDTCYRVTVTFQDETAIHTFVRLRK